MGKFLDALKNIGLKVNGTKPTSTTTVAVLNEIADDFANGTTATKEYVNSLMSGALKRAIVEALPTEDIDPNTIYMVLDETASSGNVYNEYLYINEAWELIGTTEVQTNHLYKHLLYLNDTADLVNGFIEIFTTNNTPFTSQTLFDKVKAKGDKFQYAVSPYRDNGNTATIEMHGLGYNASNDAFQIVALDFSNVSSQNPKPSYTEYILSKSGLSITNEDIEQIF